MLYWRRISLGVLGWAVVLSAIACAQAGGPWCFVCKDVFHPAICQTVSQCGDHEVCHTEKYLSNNAAEVYTTSCKDVSTCKTRGKRDVSRSLLCDECCNGTLCNADGCGAQPIKSPQQTYCLSCPFVKKPSDCDKVDVCSVDRECSVAVHKKFTLTFYKLDCISKTSCSATSSQNICCPTDLCNSNEKGVSPSQTPSKPVVSFDNPSLAYKRTYASNEVMELVCHVTGGPVPTVKWTFDDGSGPVAITSGFTSPVTGDSVLSIPTPDKSNSGKYVCQGTNSLGTASQQLTVDVKSPPRVQGSLNVSSNAQFQEDITLDCNVTMDNSTNVTWIIPPTVKSYTIHPNHSLTLYNVHGENDADYACVAENAEGNTTKTFSISVNNTSNQQATPAPCSCPNITVTAFPASPMSSTSSGSSNPGSMATSTATSTTMTSSAPFSSQSSSPPSSTPSTTTVTTATTMTTRQTTSQPVKTLPTVNIPPTSPPLIPSSTPQVLTAPTPSSRVRDQFQSEKRQVNIMLCPVSGTGNQVTWRRLVKDFDHSDPVYIANTIGVLTISQQMTVLKTGVYECLVGGSPVAQFVVYGTPANNVQCGTVFGDITKTEGVVMKAWCPPCPNPLGIRPVVKVLVNDFICESAIKQRIIPASGGNVTYLLEKGGEVAILDENAGNILVH